MVGGFNLKRLERVVMIPSLFFTQHGPSYILPYKMSLSWSFQVKGTWSI
jgi:hypothetical protein